MAISAVAESLGSLAARERRGGRLSAAATLIGPATIFVTVSLLLPILILFRYSLNAFVPGKLMVEAVLRRDYTMTQALILLVASAFVVVNFLIDLLYVALDPRISYS